MDGESGDSSTEIRITASVPDTDDSDSRRKTGEIMCVSPKTVPAVLQPTDFSIKYSNNGTRFPCYDDKKNGGSDERNAEANAKTVVDCDLEFQGRAESNLKVAEYLGSKDGFREFRNNFQIGSTDSAIGLTKEQRVKATEFAVALNYNKDPHRTSDFAGMILHHHQRFVTPQLPRTCTSRYLCRAHTP
ncbi:hypothetical protein RUM44_011148 [Polyplax serrata]|uniref:Uncharacterized protein n=1 Tax=Polyplax serrata TaxID=468196 RepID=A0ABR1AQQ7_POLSC